MSDLSRRDFLKLVGAGSVGTGAGVLLSESSKRPLEQYVPYVVTPEDYSPGIATWYHTVCDQCTAPAAASACASAKGGPRRSRAIRCIRSARGAVARWVRPG